MKLRGRKESLIISAVSTHRNNPSILKRGAHIFIFNVLDISVRKANHVFYVTQKMNTILRIIIQLSKSINKIIGLNDMHRLSKIFNNLKLSTSKSKYSNIKILLKIDSCEKGITC